MNTASISKVKSHLEQLLKDSANGPVVVTRKGKPVAVLLPMTDEDELERFLMAYSPKLQAMLDAACRRMDAGQGIPEEEFWKQVEAENQKRPKRRKSA